MYRIATIRTCKGIDLRWTVVAEYEVCFQPGQEVFDRRTPCVTTSHVSCVCPGYLKYRGYCEVLVVHAINVLNLSRIVVTIEAHIR